MMYITTNIMTHLKLDTSDQWVLALDEYIDINKTILVYHVSKNIHHCNMWFIENDTLLSRE